VLQVNAVSKAFGAVQAVRSASLSVAPGEIIGLVGGNGAGKSTLIGIISGLVEPDAGTVLTPAGPLVATTASASAAGIHVAPQELLVCPDLSIAENVLLGHLPRRGGAVDWRATRELAAKRLARLGIADLDVRRRVGGLSVVERAFVQIARALQEDTKLLITDEPTAPMSGSEVDRLLQVLRTLASRGVAVLYVSHRLDEIFDLTDRMVVMRDGQVVAELPTRDTSRATVVETMVGRELALPEGVPTTATGAPILWVRDLTSNDLRGVSFDVAAGEKVAVYGVAGSGRDALGPAMFGSVPRRAASLKVKEHEFSATASPAASIVAGLGYVPAERRTDGLMLDRSIRENLTLAVLPRLTRRSLLNRKRERELAQEWRARLDIKTPDLGRPVKTLSGGGQQKVLLARWLMAGCSVLVLDEPTRGVDIQTKHDIYGLMDDLVQQEMAVVVISSDLEEVVHLNCRVIVMRAGITVLDALRPTRSTIVSAALGEDQAA
jgi:ABC-type sugar transport system ATPase subunit